MVLGLRVVGGILGTNGTKFTQKDFGGQILSRELRE